MIQYFFFCNKPFYSIKVFVQTLISFKFIEMYENVFVITQNKWVQIIRSFCFLFIPRNLMTKTWILEWWSSVVLLIISFNENIHIRWKWKSEKKRNLVLVSKIIVLELWKSTSENSNESWCKLLESINQLIHVYSTWEPFTQFQSLFFPGENSLHIFSLHFHSNSFITTWKSFTDN